MRSTRPEWRPDKDLSSNGMTVSISFTFSPPVTGWPLLPFLLSDLSRNPSLTFLRLRWWSCKNCCLRQFANFVIGHPKKYVFPGSDFNSLHCDCYWLTNLGIYGWILPRLKGEYIMSWSICTILPEWCHWNWKIFFFGKCWLKHLQCPPPLCSLDRVCKDPPLPLWTVSTAAHLCFTAIADQCPTTFKRCSEACWCNVPPFWPCTVAFPTDTICPLIPTSLQLL